MRIKIEDGAPSWQLEDAEQRERDAPDFYPIPSREARCSLRAGDQAELLFCFSGRDEHGPFIQSERLRVTVREFGGANGGMATLDSSPVSSELLRAGDAVHFEPRHVFRIHPAAGAGGR